MRFLASGPPIPDELLLARDEGRVVFFCGAGVSRARAQLPGFLSLAIAVSDYLGVAESSPTRQIIQEAQRLSEVAGMSGLLPADRVFGLLEREFAKHDINAAVAKALVHSSDVDLTAHQTLIDLARAPTGEVRLVTTNFDLLFEQCDNSLKQWSPPELPSPSRPNQIHGVIHLHGRVTPGYDGAFGDGFVLSSSEFGKAYLADGWATNFIRAILEHYFVVFVGYTADDPPVQYLLEALNRPSDRGRTYAFQSGEKSEAEAKWRHRGVQAIAYDPSNGHGNLWATLAAWAGRARNVDKWYDDTIGLAAKGPGQLERHERGQVAHLFSTVLGARKVAEASEPPSAEWLCVLDPYVRYAAPQRSFESNETFDPFYRYSLDSDPVPSRLDPSAVLPKRDVPADAWDGLATSAFDQRSLRRDNVAALRGSWAIRGSNLPSRLQLVGHWIARVAHQPMAVWWAAGQAGLHPNIQNQIAARIEHSKEPSAVLALVRRGWRYLAEAWDTPDRELRSDWYGLKASIDLDGWSDSAIRSMEGCYRPHLTVERSRGTLAGVLGIKEDLGLEHLMHIDVEYPNEHEDPTIPDEWLAAGVSSFRRDLDLAVRLEQEISKYGLYGISPIRPQADLGDDVHQRTHGISRLLLFYVEVFTRLVTLNIEAARREMSSWPDNRDHVFTRLWLWAAGDPRLVSPREVTRLFRGLSEAAFWDSHHARDLVTTLAKRWNEFPRGARKLMEDRILRVEKEDLTDKENVWRLHDALSRISWLRNQGCELTFDFDARIATLRALAPEWRPEYAQSADASMESRSGWVKTDKDHAQLLQIPLRNILEVSKARSGPKPGLFVESDPFAGLCMRRPVRALSALTDAARQGGCPIWAWETFLREDRKADPPKLAALIAYRLSRVPETSAKELARTAANWLQSAGAILRTHYPDAFERLWVHLVAVIKTSHDHTDEAASRDTRDWATDALNSAAGSLVQVLFDDPDLEKLKLRSGLPDAWMQKLSRLLELDGDARRHVLVFVGQRLHWLDYVDPSWVDATVLPMLKDNGLDRDAFWAGFFWAARIPSRSLYQKLKPHLLSLPRSDLPEKRGHSEVLAAIVLAGWGSVDESSGSRFVSDGEMRSLLIDTNEGFRFQILWQLRRWGAKPSDKAANGDKDGSRDKSPNWYELLPMFLRTVWPRQKAANSARVSKQLFDIAFDSDDRFPLVSGIVLPLVSRVDREDSAASHVSDKKGDVIDRHPTEALALLHAALPEDPTAWPYGIEAALRRIALARPALKSDARFLDLLSRQDRR